MKERALWAVLLTLFLPASAGATSPAPPVMGSWMGVQVKEERLSSDEMDRIKAAGLDTVRFPLPWSYVERARGVYRWWHFDSVMERLKEKGMKAVIILGGGNELYTPENLLSCPDKDGEREICAPRSPEEVAAFARFAVAAVSRFGTKDIVWEIGNEPDMDRFWPPRADPEAYTVLAQITCRTIKSVAPDAQIIGPALADMPGVGERGTQFAQTFLSENTACFDGFSLHPYRDGATPPESVLEAYEAARATTRRLTPGRRDPLPLLVTEWGFSEADVGAAAQADYAARVFLLSAFAGVPLTIWYEWRDSPTDDPANPEGHFGLLTEGRASKTAYKALADILSPLGGSVLESRLDLGHPDRWALVFRGPDAARRLVFWTARPSAGGLLRLIVPAAGEYSLTGRPQLVEIGEDGSPVVDVLGRVAP